MKRFIRAFVSAPLFALSLPIIVSADTLARATVDCGGGSPLTAAVDLDTLTQIQRSIQGMLDNPSGMSCRLSQPTLAGPPSTGSDPGSVVVGGARYDRDVMPIKLWPERLRGYDRGPSHPGGSISKHADAERSASPRAKMRAAKRVSASSGPASPDRRPGLSSHCP